LGAASVTAYTTHGVLTGKAIEKIADSKLKELVITDSIDNSTKVKPNKKIRIISVADLLGEAIKRISEESSVSSLFNF
jgi:ribose-phosphate pyrophosphokinase